MPPTHSKPDPLEKTAVLSVSEGYLAWAPLYDADDNPLVAVEGPAMQAWIQTIRGAFTLDLGCGTGRHTISLLESGSRITATDQSDAMLSIARSKLASSPVNWVLGSIGGGLPFRNGAFETVLMSLVADHLKDIRRPFGEIARVLAPGGELLFSVLHPDRTEAGETARFINPATGLRQPVETYHHSKESYIDAAGRAGLSLIEQQVLSVPAELAAVLPRARKYLDLPLGWLVRWRNEVV